MIYNFIKTVCLTILIVTLTWTTYAQKPQTNAQPNILWIYLEDTAPLLGCYGTSVIATPNIDKLAKNGIRFTNTYMPAPVCSPSRSSVITGTMSTTLGLHNHHSARTKASAIYLPKEVKTIPELFIKAGYFTFNNGKDDYNFTYDRKKLYSQSYFQHPLYGKSGERIDLAKLKSRQPFFGQIQLYGGKEIFSSKFKSRVKSPVDRKKVKLPPYLPNHPAIVEEYANHLDAIQITDKRVGDIMKKLKENGLLKNTIVFFFSDHGMRLTRHKQFLYDGGIKVPLILAGFGNHKLIKPGTVQNDLVSGIDLGTTSLAMAGIPIPGYMEGKHIFAKNYQGRQYVISTRDRCDFTIDRIRSVRSKKFKYIRNFLTDRPYAQPTYMDADGVEFVKVMKQLSVGNKLNAAQSLFFADKRPSEELYNLKDDPFELVNLAKDPKYASVLAKYAKVLDQWIIEMGDKGQYPEKKEGLMLMLGIWGKHAVNPEYDPIRKQHKDLAGSLYDLKRQKWKKVQENEK